MGQWLPPEEKLDPQQKEFLKRENGFLDKKNVWIKGFPGSGKSVLVAYAIKKILENPETCNNKILLVLFTRSLVDLYKKGFKDMEKNIDVVTCPEFYRMSIDMYDHIFCDEVQDLSPAILSMFREKSNHVVVAGDENQSIYSIEPFTKQATVVPTQIPSLINAESYSLIYIHRLSRSIIAAIQKMMPNINIFEAKRDETKKDVQIRICTSNSKKEETEYVYKEACRRVERNYTTAILLPTSEKIIEFCNTLLTVENKPVWNFVNNQYNRPDWRSLNQHLLTNGISVEYVGNGYGSLSHAEQHKNVVLMTYHSAKGLDFENVFIPYTNNELFRHTNFNNIETLFMVAMTRGKENLYITYNGNLLSYVQTFSSEKSICTNIEINGVQANSDDIMMLDF